MNIKKDYQCYTDFILNTRNQLYIDPKAPTIYFLQMNTINKDKF